MKKTVLLLLAILGSTAASTPLDITTPDRLIIQNLLNGEWQRSDSIVTAELQRAPDSPKLNFFKAYVAFYSRFFSRPGLEREASIRVMEEYTWRGIVATERLPVTTDTKFYLGNLYGLLCRANSMRQEYWYTYWNARKARRLLREVVEEDSTLVDAYLNLAVIEYYPSVAVTGFRGFLAWLGGMSGDRAKGLKLFEKVGERGALFQDEALFALTIVYRYGENDIARSAKAWGTLHDRYPQNALFENGYRQATLAQAIQEKGVEFIERESATLREAYGVDNAGVLNTLAYAYMAGQQNHEAFVLLSTNLKLFPAVANCYDSMGEWYFNTGDFPNARKYYQLAREKLEADTSATEQFKEALKTGIAQKFKEMEGK